MLNYQRVPLSEQLYQLCKVQAASSSRTFLFHRSLALGSAMKPHGLAAEKSVLIVLL